MLLLSSLLGCLVCSAAALGTGAPLMRLFINRETQDRLQVGPLAMAASAFLLGQGVLAGVWTLIGLAGWFTAPVVLATLLLPAVFGIWAAKPWLWIAGILPAGGRDGRGPGSTGILPACGHQPLQTGGSVENQAAVRGSGQAGPFDVAQGKQPDVRTAIHCLKAWLRDAWADSWPWRVLLLLTLLLMLFYVMAAWVSAIPARHDGAAYYLPLAKWLVAKGQLRPFPGYEHLFQMPMLGELHFAAMMFFGVEQEARLIATPTAFAGAVLLIGLGARCGLGRRAQWILLAMVWSSTTFTERLIDGKTEIFGFAMGFAAYYWVAIYRDRNGTAALRLAGLFAGLAVMAKLTLATSVLPGVALFTAWTAACAEERAGAFQRARAVVVGLFHLAFWGLLFGVANGLKNGMLYGQPLAPLYFFGATESWIYNTAFHSQDVALSVLLSYPFLLVFGHVRGQGGNMSLLFLAFAPLVIAIPKCGTWTRSLLLKTTCMALLGIACYLAATHITSNAQVAPRYILPTLLLLALPLACAAEQVIVLEPRPRLLAAMVWLSLFAAVWAGHREKSLRRWAKYVGYHVTRGENLPDDTTIDALKELNRLAALGDRVYSLTATRLFMRSDLLQCINSSADPISGNTPEALWGSLHARGFSWFIIDRPTRTNELPLWGIQVDGRVSLSGELKVECVFASPRCFLLRLKPAPGAPAPEVKTIEVRPGVWEVVPNDGGQQ